MTEVRSKRAIEIIRLYAAGVPIHTIAEQCGCSTINVGQLAKYHGVNRKFVRLSPRYAVSRPRA